MPNTSIWLSILSAYSARESTGECFASPSHQNAGRDQRLVRAVLRIAARLRQQVAGDVFDHELVEGQVGVEGADDVVAVAPGVGDVEVELVAVRLGVADQVEPVAAPALAVVRGWRGADRRPSRTHLGESSFRKAAISSGVGGRPIRSNVTRRSRARFSAGGANSSP